MSERWSYKVVEIEFKLFAGKLVDRVQAELDRLGAQGWELVAVAQGGPADSMKLFLKKSA